MLPGSSSNDRPVQRYISGVGILSFLPRSPIQGGRTQNSSYNPSLRPHPGSVSLHCSYRREIITPGTPPVHKKPCPICLPPHTRKPT